MRGTKAKRLRKQAKLFNKGTQMPYSAFEWRPQWTNKRVVVFVSKWDGDGFQRNTIGKESRFVVKGTYKIPHGATFIREEPYLAKSVALVHGCTRQVYQMLKRVA